MEKQQTTLVDPKLVNLEQWLNILTHEDFAPSVREYISSRVSIHRSKVEELGREPGLDSSIKISALLSRIDELKVMSNHFDRMFEKAKDAQRRSAAQ